MNREQLVRMKLLIKNREDAVGRVLTEYCRQDGCPCGFKKFVYWAGKEQGPGWHDSIQNQLVKSALKLKCFKSVEDFKKQYWLESEYYCKNCGTRWNHFSEEWRMLAFRERLLIIGEENPGELFDGVISDEIFATAGSEPTGRKTLSISQWVEFMLS